MNRKIKIVLLLLLGAGLIVMLCSMTVRFLRHTLRSMAPLRVLVLEVDQEAGNGLHRIEMPIDRERALLQNFARAEQRRIEYVQVASFPELFCRLKEGKGDLISANLSETPERKKAFLLSVPFDYTREVVFAASSIPLKQTAAMMLADRTGQLLPGTTYVENADLFSFVNPWFRCRVLPETLSHDALIEKVAAGEIDFSILNEGDLDAWCAYRTGIRKLFPIRSKVPLVFAARKEDRELIRKLDRFIQSLQRPERQLKPVPPPAPPRLAAKPQTVQPQTTAVPKAAAPKAAASKAAILPGKPLKSVPGTEDLKKIRKRGYLRMLTSNEFFTCYLKQGRICGFEYELAKRFADRQNLRVITVIPPRFEDLTKYLAEGKGDFIAVNYTRTPERLAAYPNFTFCAPYHGAAQVLAGRSRDKIPNAGALAGRKIHVRKGNSYYATARKLQAQGMKFTIVPIPETENALATLRKVADGTYDLTIVDDNFLNFAISGGVKVKKLMTLTEKQPFCWVVRKQNPQLAAAVNAFFRQENRSTFFNLCVKRYYSPRTAQSLMNWVQKSNIGRISPYDGLFRKYAEMYDFNWYFLAAQSYQESRFSPKQVNEIGATGLMQMMPATAKELGIRDLKQPENAIHAGTKYMSKLRTRFPEQEMTPMDRLCFALASYNAGYGHVLDARKLAKQKGLNPNIWFNHTEKALALLEDPQYAGKAKFGYCRASETIPYVHNIILLGDHYQKMQPAQQVIREKYGPRRKKK